MLHVASTSVLRHQGRVARCLQEAVSQKTPGARHANLPGSRVVRRALQVRCLGGLRSTRLLLLDPPEWMPLCRVAAWGGCAWSGVSR